MKTKIKFVILTCEKYHDNRVESIRKTWGKNQDIWFLSDFNQGDDIIGFDYLQRGYENIWMKYSEFLKNLSSIEHDWYFFTDDDTFVNIDNINQLLKNYNSSDAICIGHVGALNSNGTDMDGNFTGFPMQTIIGKDTNLPLYYVSGGAGFILSKKSMNLICEYIRSLNSYEIPRSYNGDVTFGFWMRNSGIKVQDILGFWWTNPNELNHTKEQIQKSYTYHYVNELNMVEIHNSTTKKIENCIITQSKDQSKRLKDWILYHFEQGFDTFVYYDDYSEDDSIEILNNLKINYGLNIIIKFSDGIGNKKSKIEMSNSESYGGDTSINYRIIRSYNSGLNLIKQHNPDAICAFLDVDEFLVSNTSEKITEIIRRNFKEENTNLVYIHSFDIKNDYNLNDWYISDENTNLRWDYLSRSESDFKNRGKSVCIAKSIDEIYQRPNFVHQLREIGPEEDVSYNNFEKLRIHHFRKPNLPNNNIMFTEDYTLIEKSKLIKEKYEKI